MRREKAPAGSVGQVSLPDLPSGRSPAPTRPTLRVGVVGAGRVGAVLGAALRAAGLDDARIAALRAAGVVIDASDAGKDR